MVEILSDYQKSAPDVKDYRIKVSGDGLTSMRAREAILMRADGLTPERRLKKMYVGSEDFHQQVNVLQVS